MRCSQFARALAGLGAVAFIAAAAGCLRRDVSAEKPTTKISFATEVPQPAIDKVDVLLMIDNSQSMADKQKILAKAVPDLVRGLLEPKCVDKKTRLETGTTADPLKPEPQQCPAGSEPAFKPITDMHVGVVTSSMGTFGALDLLDEKGQTRSACPAGGHNDDQGHLVARARTCAKGDDPKKCTTSGTIADAGDLHFLAWYPDVEANKDKLRHPDPPVPKLADTTAFIDAFGLLVSGVGQDGCGLEAQLESWYHFLIQPDPWGSIDASSGQAKYPAPNDVDWVVLKQRAAFLRPDSLVAIIVLTDEDDSSVDPLAVGGTAHHFMARDPMGRGTSICATDPLHPDCTSCAFAATCKDSDPACQKLKQDPSCAKDQGVYASDLKGPRPIPDQLAEDAANARFVRMKQRFGVDPQFPITRYTDALTKLKVARRDKEHDHSAYRPQPACTNPLFAAHLPTAPGEEICALPRGPRTKDLVYFAIIGGVPNRLLPDDPTAKIDWTPILGRDPARLDDTGMDPHMLQSIVPREGLPQPSAADDADPVNGREWDTGGDDLQYACTFPLTEAPDCDADHSCYDCDGKKHPPLCSPATTQVRAKSYPTRRELLVAQGLGDHAVVASLCPKQLVNDKADDYGYRPAVRAIAARLAGGLTASCLPRALDRDPDGTVPCVVMALLPDPGPDSDCQKRYGLANPNADVVAKLRDRLAGEEGDAVRKLPVCAIPPFTAPDAAACRGEENATGFCYAEHDPLARTCDAELIFTKPTARLVGARFTMQCITLGQAGNGP